MLNFENGWNSVTLVFKGSSAEILLAEHAGEQLDRWRGSTRTFVVQSIQRHGMLKASRHFYRLRRMSEVFGKFQEYESIATAKFDTQISTLTMD